MWPENKNCVRVAHGCAGTNKICFIIFPEDRSRMFLLNVLPLTKNRVEKSTILTL